MRNTQRQSSSVSLCLPSGLARGLCGRNPGFTLIELTVVVAVISILAAIFFPVFTQAREKAKSSGCLSNLYQMGMALQLYARDYDGRFPPRDHDLGPLRGYVNEPGVFQCPTDPLADQLRTANRSAELLVRPFLYSGYQYRGGLSGEDRADLPLAADWEFRHSGLAALLSLSGSVKMVKWDKWRPVAAGPRPLPPGVRPSAAFRPTPMFGDPPAAPPNPSGGM